MVKKRKRTMQEVKQEVNPMFLGMTTAAAVGLGINAVKTGIDLYKGFKGTSDAQVAEDEAQRASMISEIDSNVSGGGQYKSVEGGIVNPYKMGGSIDGEAGDLQSFDSGGSHEENPNGGVMIGMGENGKPNTVEEGETKYGDYVFTDRVAYVESELMPKSLGNGTFAEVSKQIEKMFKERSDAYSNATKKDLYDRLFALQGVEVQKLEESNPEFVANGRPDQNQMAEGNNPILSYKESYDLALTDAEFEASLAKKQADYAAGTTRDVGVEPTVYKYPDSSGDISDEPNPWNSIGAGIGIASQSAGIVSNIMGMRSNKEPERVQPRLVGSADISPNLVNRQAILRQTAEGVSTATKAISEMSGGDFGSFASNVAGAQSSGLKTNSMAMLESDIADARELARVQESILGAKQFDARQRTAADVATAQDYAAYEAQKDAYMQGIAGNVGSMGQTLLNYTLAKKTGRYMNISATMEGASGYDRPYRDTSYRR